DGDGERRKSATNGDEPVSTVAELGGDQGEEDRGKGEVEAVALGFGDPAADQRPHRDATHEGDEDGGRAAEEDRGVGRPRSRHRDRERLVVDDMRDQRQSPARERSEGRRQRRRHQVVTHVHDVGGEDDGERRRAGRDHGHGDELGGAAKTSTDIASTSTTYRPAWTARPPNTVA